MSDRTSSRHDREHGSAFLPRFDQNGLVSAVVLDTRSREVLVVAFMNAEAIERTRQSGNVTFWSRSRQRLWMKGETSGNVLKVDKILVDCDQDTLVILAEPAGPTCHTGARSCFYRELDPMAADDVALTPFDSGS